MPQVSIITPVWNGRPLLEVCVDSVLAQEFQDWELLISDDGSSDASRDYLASLSDPRIRVFLQDRNLGIFGNLNFLFDQATAPISQILCQDDYFTTPAALGEIVGSWAAMSAEVGFMRCNASPANGGHDLRSYGERVMPEIIRPGESDLFFFLFGCIPGNLSNVSLRTALVARVGGFRQAFPYAGDFDFWSRAAQLVAFRRAPAAWVHIRAHEGQASSQLNLRGELVPQLYAIIDRLYETLSPARGDLLLRLYAAITYDAQHRLSGLRNILKAGDTTYLRAVDDSGDRFAAFPNPALRWIVFVLSLGGRIGAVLVAKRLLAAPRGESGRRGVRV